MPWLLYRASRLTVHLHLFLWYTLCMHIDTIHHAISSLVMFSIMIVDMNSCISSPYQQVKVITMESCCWVVHVLCTDSIPVPIHLLSFPPSSSWNKVKVIHQQVQQQHITSLCLDWLPWQGPDNICQEFRSMQIHQLLFKGQKWNHDFPCGDYQHK